jgi:hypothetical protein
MVAAWTLGQVSPRLFRVKMITADAMERNLATLGVVKLPVALIVIKPQKAKSTKHQHSVRKQIKGEIRDNGHAPQFTPSNAGAKMK